MSAEKEISVEQLQADVCVVGAGFAGLAAARHLQSQGKTVVVLEASGQAGGRVRGRTLGDGTEVSLGGTWLGRNQARAFDLCGKMGLGVYPQFEDGEIVLRLHGENSRYKGMMPRVGWWGLLWLGVSFERLNELAATLPLDAPWEAKPAAELDAQTLGGWISSDLNVPSDRAQILLRTSLGLLFSTDPAEVSLLGSLVLARGGGDAGFQYYADASYTETHLVDGGGTPELARRLGEALGDALRLSAPVRRIAQDDGGVTVTADGVEVTAQYVIVTAPPVVAAQIDYEPPLPDAYGHLLRKMPPGAIIRFITVYHTPFWRDCGLTGQTVAPESPVAVSIDQSPPSGAAGAPPPYGVLSSYAFGREAVRLARMDADERRALVLAELAKRLGDDAAHPKDYVELDWSADPWAQGGMIAHFPPGVLTTYGPVLHQPWRRIWWAGSERAAAFHGLIEGAIRSGEQAAADILDQLGAGATSAS
jgi:monoamine oxidase